MPRPAEEVAAEIAAARRHFRAAGLPLFDEAFSASTDIFNRAAPILAVVFAAEMFGAIQLDWSLAANVAAATGGLAVLLTAAMALNRFGGRAWLAVPETVGRVELAAFVVVPALLPLIFGAQGRSAIGTALANLGLLVMIYAILGYGLPSVVVWTLRHLASRLATSLMLLARAVPLLLIFALLAFVSTEMWQVFGSISIAGLVASSLLFVGLGSAFLVARLPREIRRLEATVEAATLRAPQRRNVGLVLLVSQAIQVLLVSLLVGAFFVIFGAIAISDAVREAWLGPDGFGEDSVLATIEAAGLTIKLTASLLKVSAALASFTGLYFAIAILTDSTYRAEFLEEITEGLRESFEVRARYLALRGEQATPPPTR